MDDDVKRDLAVNFEGDEEKQALLSEGASPLGMDPFFAALKPSRKTFFKLAIFSLAVIISATVFLVDSIFPHDPTARRALSLFLFVAILWALEVIPLYITSLSIPILIVTMRVLKDANGEVLDADDAATQVMAQLFSGTVLIALGAFTMSAAFSKYDLSYRVAAAVLSRVGKKPWVVMLTVMFLGLFLAMWMNNVASPVVVVSVVQPMLNEFRADDIYAKALLLGIAYSNNIGGMTSPISSPQNLVAFQVINSRTWNNTKGVEESSGIGWGEFIGVSLPFSIVCTLVAFAFLWFAFRPAIKEVNPVPPRKVAPITVIHVVVIIVCLLTIILWALGKQIETFVGSSGIVALIPVIVFFTLPILSKEDFKNLSWGVLMLLAGGLALGDAIKSSGLLNLMATSLADTVRHSNLWVVFLAFASFIWLFGNFISHTVAAIIILPVIASVGCDLGGGDCAHGHFALLVIGAVLVDSGAMGLPVTSFPNAQCYSVKDSEGTPYLTALDYVKTGFPIGVLEVVVLMVIGYPLLLLVL